MSVKHRLVTAEQLLEMPEVPGKGFELADGEVVACQRPARIDRYTALRDPC